MRQTTHIQWFGKTSALYYEMIESKILKSELFVRPDGKLMFIRENGYIHKSD